MGQRADRNPVHAGLRELPYVRERDSAGGLEANSLRRIVCWTAPIVFRKPHLLDRLAHRFGETCYEVPVGFKHVVAAMVEHDAVLGGESSGGLTIRGHILGKDGIFACALVVEMLAKTGQKISQLRERVYSLIGRLYQAEESIPATPEMRVAIPRRLREAPGNCVGSYPVLKISQVDGTKLYLENDNWALLRFSGTEPVLRLAVEADSPEKAAELLQWLRQFVKA